MEADSLTSNTMEIIKKNGLYYEIKPVGEGFDIEREIGVLEDEIREREIKLKSLKKEKDKE